MKLPVCLTVLLLLSSSCFAGQPIAVGMQLDSNTMLMQSGTIMATGMSPVPTAVLDTNYSSSCSDQIIAYQTLTAARTVTLTPCGSPSLLKCRQIKDLTGNASTATPINLASTSGTFDGLGATAISQPR